MIKRITLSVFIIILSCCALNGCTELGAAFASHDMTEQVLTLRQKQATDPETWMMHYYQHPLPAKTPYMINKMIQNGTFNRPDQNGAENISIFFAYIFKRYPSKITTWMDQIKFTNDRSKQIIDQALWDSNTPAGHAYLNQLKKTKAHSAIIQKIMLKAPEKVLHKKMSPKTLDHLWAAFFAMGHVKYLKPIIKVGASKKGQYPSKVIGAAKWSLISNGKNYYDLPCIYLALAKEMDKNESAFLRNIVKNDIFKNKKYVISCHQWRYGVADVELKTDAIFVR